MDRWTNGKINLLRRIGLVRHFIGDFVSALLYAVSGSLGGLLGSLCGLLRSGCGGILSIFTSVFQVLADLTVKRASNQQCNGKYSYFHVLLLDLKITC